MNLATRARPYFGAVVITCGLLTAGGIYSAMRMPSGVYPEVTFPRIAVVARVPDFDISKMEFKVTRPLEDAVSSVLGVAQVRSKTIRGGSEISIDFNPGTDMRQAETLTWNRIGARRSELPPNMDLTVEQMTPSVFPILSLVLTGGDNSAQLRDYAYYQLAPLIKTIPDVLYANVAGGDVREIEVIARPDDLLAAGMSAADLADQITQQSSLHPVGRIEGQPFAFQLLVNSQPESIRQIEEMVISSRKDQPLRVRDLAEVKVLHQDRGLSVGFDQRDAVVITIFRRLGGNTVNISRDLRALLDRNGLTLPAGSVKKPQPRNIQATVVYDQATFVETAVHNVRDAILIGGLFSVLILLAFLRSWRATLISALAIPTTLAITFLFLYWSGSNAQPDVAGRPGGRHRPHHRRHRCRRREHRSPPVQAHENSASEDRRCRSRGLRRDHRRGGRLDADDRAGLPAAGRHRRRLRPVLRGPELVAVDRGAGVDGHQPDAGAGIRGQVPGWTADAGAGTDL